MIFHSYVKLPEGNRLTIAFGISEFSQGLSGWGLNLDEVLRPGLPSATHANESTDAERSAQRCWERKTMGKTMGKTMLIDDFIGVERG